MRVLGCATILAVASATSDTTSKTPVENVIDLLSNLKAEVTKEGEDEAKTYGEFSKFCTDTDAAKSESIKMGELQESESKGTIDSKNSDLKQTNSDIKARTADGEALSAAKDASIKQCTKDEINYDAQNADLTGAINGLQAAIEKLAVAKEAKGSLIQLGNDVGLSKSLKLAEVMGFMPEAKKQSVTAFLQNPAWLSDAGEEKNKEEYAFQSDGIVSLLNDLLKQFQEEKSTTDDAWTKTKKSCEDVFATKTEEIAINDDTMAKLNEQASVLSGEKATEEELLLKTQEKLSDDGQYLKELQENCAVRARDWDQRSKQREGEIGAIEAALGVFQDKVKGLDESANGRAEVAALLEPSFLQEKETAHRSVNLLSRGSRGKVSSAAQAQARALAKAAARQLTQSGIKLGSARIAGLAVRMSLRADREEPNAAASPLETVKVMVQKLVNDLLAEAQAEASQKGSCDVQLNRAKSERNRRMNEAEKISAKLQKLESNRVRMNQENALMTDELAQLREDLIKATDLRVAESKENRKTVEEATEGKEAVELALAELQAFYKKAGKTTELYDQGKSFLQVNSKQTPVDAGFAGGYAGKQNAASGIVDMMKVIQTDFERTVTDTKASEEQAADAFTKFRSESNVDISNKETGIKLNTDELASTTNKLNEEKANLQNTFDLLDGALETLEDLKPTCVDNAMSYEERKAKRDKEIGDLTTALCLLDTNGVEPLCQAA
eukprot:TRINITY_DN2021_c0_g2_i1.p1 TRINITY_DN2021_c0_g2~~TRINITY_DN2021_c0_g2_i1.p1  ORF type:complete len:726 (-),score=248.28 TRINITY_DN2021_c0_g2_i1:70-2247(-)